MNQTRLFMAPGTCARVTAIALEEVGEPFETVVVRFMKGEHKSAEFRRMNPKGKVPTLLIDGHFLTENVAILQYLDERHPGASLLPTARTAAERAQRLADLCFCGSTLHPIVTRIRMAPFIAGPDCAAPVWRSACNAMKENFELVERRLDSHPWWYGDAWSAMDAYLYWVFWRVEGAEFDVTPFPAFRAHAARMSERPAVQRTLAREQEAQKLLAEEGLAFTPPRPSDFLRDVEGQP